MAEACKGNLEAIDFLNRWNDYAHAVDDVIDEEVTKDFKIATFAKAIDIHTHPFYLKYLHILKPIEIQLNNLFADSVEFEKSDEKWKRDFSDWARHGAAEMVIAVARIVGGYEHMRLISLETRRLCYFEHHKEDGTPC